MSSATQKKAAWVVLITNPSYLPGLFVLHHSLRSVGTRYPLVVIATPQLSAVARAIIARRGIPIRDVQSLRPRPGVHQLAEHDRRFEDTWTKLRSFELVEFDRVVMMDADMLVRRNMDELMELPLPRDSIAASHVCACNPRKLAHYPKDWIPENCAFTPLVAPDCLSNPPRITRSSPRPYNLLNSGLVVLTPSLKTYNTLEDWVHNSPLIPTFSFPDQDLLSAVFAGRWKPLPYIYNALKPLRNVHPKMWRDEDVKVVHYILDKPWQARIGPGSKGEKSDFVATHAWWWEQYGLIERELNSDGPSGDLKTWATIDRYVSKD
ncbi:glycosyltransferase family 8 protein [Tulasnella calospora MUT 4182]|uniref:Glycosyltransferase family 8 protein n=1 Tax=Tulasnella calospora MUT 4182 TaxID=1051891 RepID=A0A0C3QIJ0_9AGAM|nr:glycosyltransferase family 8 protein [Tulasnella calospora MUT 4182]